MYYLQTHRGLGAVGLGLGSVSDANDAKTAFELLLTEFQLMAARATGNTLEKLSWLDKKMSGAVEWATNINNFAANVVVTLKRPTAGGQPFYVAFPEKAAKLLGQAAAFVEEESKAFEQARDELLNVARITEQAAVQLGRLAGSIAAAAGTGAAAAAREGVAAAFAQAKRAGVSGVLNLLLGLGLFGAAGWLVLRIL